MCNNGKVGQGLCLVLIICTSGSDTIKACWASKDVRFTKLQSPHTSVYYGQQVRPYIHISNSSNTMNWLNIVDFFTAIVICIFVTTALI